MKKSSAEGKDSGSEARQGADLGRHCRDPDGATRTEA